MTTRLLLIFSYIFHCCRLRVGPWKYFQLNAKYFNEKKGIFSKLEIDRLIPQKWRLQQIRDDGVSMPNNFPVFVKPEWGQNAYGIKVAHNIEELNSIRADTQTYKQAVLLQHAAIESTEYEVFTTLHPDNSKAFGHMTVTRVDNSIDENYPINSINNSGTQYIDISAELSHQDQKKLWLMLSEIGRFNIARFGLRANSLENLLAGRFHIIEINLFLPMPIQLLCPHTSGSEKRKFIFSCTHNLAKLTKQIPRSQRPKGVFFRKMKAHKQVKADAQARVH